MKFFKSLAIAGALCLAAFSSHAQFFGGTYGATGLPLFTNVVTGTNILAISYTTNYTLPGPTNATAPLISCPNNHTLAIQLQGNGVYSNATVSLGITRSLDGINWDSTNFALLTATMTTGGLNVSTNFDIGAYGFFSVLNFTNIGSISNFAARYAIKPGY